MKLQTDEAEEPPSRPQAAHTLLSKPQLPVDTLTPLARPGLTPGLGMLTARTERFPAGPRTRAFRKRYFPDIDPRQWNDWRWQARNRIRSLEQLERVFALSGDERDAVVRHQGSLPLGITPYYASLMSRDDPDEPLRRTHIPVGTEYIKTPGEADDPLGEDGHSAVPGLADAPLPRPRSVPGHGLLFDLLPLLHALAHGRRCRRRLLVQPAAMEDARSTISPTIRRSAMC